MKLYRANDREILRVARDDVGSEQLRCNNAYLPLIAHRK